VIPNFLGHVGREGPGNWGEINKKKKKKKKRKKKKKKERKINIWKNKISMTKMPISMTFNRIFPDLPGLEPRS
jgi:hypothetical protein